MIRRLRSLNILLALSLTGCGSQGGSWDDYWLLLGQSLKGSGKSISREQAAAVPYASLGYRIDGSSEGFLVLATDTAGDQLWTSASRVVLLTRGGRIIRSVGLGRDRAATAADGFAALPLLQNALTAPFNSNRSVDLPDLNAYAVQLTCTTKRSGSYAVNILGTTISTVRVDETCQSRNPRWTFTDSYWLDASGFAWQSNQHLHPNGGTVQIRIFRPPE